MNDAQRKLVLRLQLMLVVPVALGSATLVALSIARQRSLLNKQAIRGAEIAAQVIREEIAYAAFEGVTVTVIIALAVAWLAKQLGRELGAIVHGAARVGAQDLSARVAVESKLGLEGLPRAFNAMAEQLESTQVALSRASEQAQEFNERLAHAQSLAAVGQVAASIAHEVGSPLNAILVNARMAAEDEDCPPHTRRSLESIATQSDRIGAVLRRMLQLSQPLDASEGRCEVRAVVNDVFAFVGGLLRKSKVVGTTELPPHPLRAEIRAEHLQQALFNLVVNAVQEQTSGGRVVLAARRDGDRVRLEVRDAGTGVPEQDLAQLWEPFFTRKRARGGTGLGLPVVKSIIERVNGKVAVERAPEGGACFVLLLPFASDQPD